MRSSFLKIAACAMMAAGIASASAAFAQTSDNAMQHSATMAPARANGSTMSHDTMSHGNSMQHSTHMNSMSHTNAMQHDSAMTNAKPQ